MSKPSGNESGENNEPTGPDQPGQIMPSTFAGMFATYRLEQNGKEVGFVLVHPLAGGTEEIWQLYGPNVTGAHKAPYTWPSSQNLGGGQGVPPQSGSISTTFTFHSDQPAIIDVGGVGGPNYTQISAICSVMQH